MVGHLRSNCGYTGLIIGTIVANSPATVQSRLDAIDAHAYWRQDPQFPGVPWDPVNWYISNISMVNAVDDGNTLAGLARQRIKGKPFTVTEYDHVDPTYYGSEAPLLLAAYAGLQDWDGLWLYAYGPGNDSSTMGYVPGFFKIAQHPGKMANLLLAANLFRRGDVRPAAQEYTMALTPDREIDLILNTWWIVFSGSQLGVPPALALVSRLNTSVGTNAAGLTNPPAAPPGTVLTSDTGELRWDVSVANQGLVTLNTPRTRALVGFADNQPVTLGEVTLRPGTTQLGWCTLGATLTRGEVFTNDCTALIIAAGWWENTGQVWTDTNKVSVGNQWGHAPVLTEVVPFTLTLPVGTNLVQAWSLDQTGQRRSALTPGGNRSSTTLTVGTNAGSIWYELDVSRWMTSFGLWRLRYFTSDELLDPALSGAAAKPDGDAAANLLKYYLGLPGKTRAAATNLPAWKVVASGNQSYLALTYTRDKLAADVDCAAEVSTDLTNWSSGTGSTTIHSVVDLGTLEQVTVRDLTPIGAPTRHFMRLRLQLRQ